MKGIPMSTVYRQGDVLIVERKSLPKDVVEVEPEGGRIVLAYGERTGHAHAIRDLGVVKAYRSPGLRAETAEMATIAGLPQLDFLLVGGQGEALLRHEYESGQEAEHAPIALKPGVYEVSCQVEFRPEATTVVGD